MTILPKPSLSIRCNFFYVFITVLLRDATDADMGLIINSRCDLIQSRMAYNILISSAR